MDAVKKTLKKIGCLKVASVKALNTNVSEVFVSRERLKHIEERHGLELEKFGFTPFEYVRTIVRDYNSVYFGKYKNSCLLVLQSDKINHAAVIRIVEENGLWNIVSAYPINKNKLEKKKLLWRNAHNPM